jgi:hypothetical protein
MSKIVANNNTYEVLVTYHDRSTILPYWSKPGYFYAHFHEAVSRLSAKKKSKSEDFRYAEKLLKQPLSND